MQANIVLKVPSDSKAAQTPIKDFVDENVATEMVITLNR